MPDHFLALGLPRRPWLESETVKSRFLELSRSAHPDRHHQADAGTRREQNAVFASLNAAHECLANPRTRVLHLLELHSGASVGDVHRVPPAIAERFPSVVSLCKDAEHRSRAHATTDSHLLRARSARTSLALRSRLESMCSELQTLRQSHLNALRDLDARWPAATGPTSGDPAAPAPADLERLVAIAASLAFLDRWIGQLGALSFELADHASLV